MEMVKSLDMTLVDCPGLLCIKRVGSTTAL